MLESAGLVKGPMNGLGNDTERIKEVSESLFQSDKGLFIAPVRHHSPACSLALRRMIREIRPTKILIEAPCDFVPLIPHLLNAETRPPVAVVSLIEQSPDPEPNSEPEPKPEAEPLSRVAAYYPFCAHSPEWIALKEGARIGAELDFIDLSSDIKTHPDPHSHKSRLSNRALIDEQQFNQGNFIASLCRQLGCRDGFELWDHLFESRPGLPGQEDDWKDFFTNVGAYCQGLRASGNEDAVIANGDADREAHMSACVRAALGDGPVIVVIGGFHSLPLIGAADTPLGKGTGTGKAKPKRTRAESYLIRYGYKELDALTGYSAGLPSPGYYRALWNFANAGDRQDQQGKQGQPPDFAGGLISGYTRYLQAVDVSVTVPQQVELLRTARSLARLRGRQGVIRYDLIDAIKSTLVKGEATDGDIRLERFMHFLQGNELGEVTGSAGQPPIVTDARTLIKKSRFNISNGQKRSRSLDIRRNPNHLQASRLLHALALLECDFATLDSGPDFINMTKTDLLFEHWHYAWAPRVEGNLIEAAVYGDTVKKACLTKLERVRTELAEQGRKDDLAGLVAWFKRGLLAGLEADLQNFLSTLEAAILANTDFARIARTLCEVYTIETMAGPMGISDRLDVSALMDRAFERITFLCDDLPGKRADAVAPCVNALRLINGLLKEVPEDRFDSAVFEAALDRVLDARPAPSLQGAIMAIAVESNRKTSRDLVTFVKGQLEGSTSEISESFAALSGIISISPSLLWTVEGLLHSLDRFIVSLDDERFLALLPHLRLAFTELSPREIDSVAALLARHNNRDISAFISGDFGVGNEEAAAGAKTDALLRNSIREDGLADWLLPSPNQSQAARPDSGQTLKNIRQEQTTGRDGA